MAKKSFSSFITDLHESDIPPLDTESTSLAVMSLNYEDSVLEISPLDPDEQRTLNTLENVIKTGLNTFLTVGSALLEIRQKKLYRGTHLSIKAYVADRFGLGRQRAYQLMDAAQVVQDLSDDQAGDAAVHKAESTLNNNSFAPILPEKESHANALAEIAPEKRKEVWDEVIRQQKVNGKPITAKKILATAETIGASLNARASKETKKKDKEVGAEQPVSSEQTSGLRKDDHQLTGASSVPPIINQAYITRLQSAVPEQQPGDLMIRVSGRFLLRHNLAEVWQILRGTNHEIDELFYDFISLQEAADYKLL